MNKFIALLFILTAFSSLQLKSQTSEVDLGLKAITYEAIMSQTGFLASDWTEGRETGTRGEYISADYIASMLQLFGAQPGGDYLIRRDRVTGKITRERSYFQNFSLLSSSPGEEQKLSAIIFEDGISKTIEFENNIDFTTNSTAHGGSVEAPVIFVGYGYIDEKSGHNDFRNIDVEGKIILRISGIPSNAQNANSAYRLSMQKDAYAINNGVAGILELDISNTDGSVWAPQPEFLDHSPAERGPRRERIRYSIAGGEMAPFVPKASISLKAANTILKGSGIDLQKYIDSKDEPKNDRIDLKNKVYISTSVKSSFTRVRNVIGIIEGVKKDEVIVIGAHYDHLGIYDGYIYNGADDNASGTVGVLTIARAIAATGKQPEKTIIFALWTGEEKGLLGSKYFADNPTVPLDNIRINVNFDMISRYITQDETKMVTMMYSPSCPELKDITIKNIEEHNIDLSPVYLQTDNPPGGTDHRSFINKGIPYLRFKPGHREEYHTPYDEYSTLDWDIMLNIIRLTFLNVWDMAGSEW
jgi:Zn-dependent M28 family amino/carboxypeptidase